jgi:predicted phosphodiesterase
VARRVAALYDVEGNLAALDAVLGEVANEGADVVVCGGDLVVGPSPAEVFDRLADVRDVRYLRGNADRMVLNATHEYGTDWEAYRERLGEARLRAVASWPLTVELEIDGIGRALFCHATPTADDPIYTHSTPDEDLAVLLGDVDAELVVVGHTHVQFDRHLPNGPRVVNAGSVGIPFERPPGAYWALLSSRGVELRRTDYDVGAAVAELRRVGGATEEYLNELLEPPDGDETTARFEAVRRGA